MIPEKKFHGIYPMFFIYFFMIWLAISSLVIIVLTIISKALILPLFIVPFLFLAAWLFSRSNIRWVIFKSEHLVVKYIFGSQEIVEYKNVRKFLEKYQGFGNRSICTIEFEGKSKRIRKVNFRTQNLDVKLFKSQLIDLKRVKTDE